MENVKRKNTVELIIYSSNKIRINETTMIYLN